MKIKELLEALKGDPVILDCGTREFLTDIGFMRRDRNGNTVISKQGKLFLKVMKE